MVSPLKETDLDRSLHWCPPLPNCVSTEGATFIHNVEPFELKVSLDEAWPLITTSVSNLTGAEVEHGYHGYIHAKVYSDFFNFLDYFEVLAIPEENRLSIRSSSLLGITDFSVNRNRGEQFRNDLIKQGIIK